MKNLRYIGLLSLLVLSACNYRNHSSKAGNLHHGKHVVSTAECKTSKVCSEFNTQFVANESNVVLFSFDSNVVQDRYHEIIKEMADFISDALRKNVDIRLKIEGHADERGTEDYNVQLSIRRAQSLRDLLVSYGVDEDLISIVGLGAKNPIHVDGTEEMSWSRNRYGEIVLLPGNSAASGA